MNRKIEDIWVLEIPTSPVHPVHPVQSSPLGVTQPKGPTIIKDDIMCIFNAKYPNTSPIYIGKLSRMVFVTGV
jgi:hypothetical protein